MRDRLIFKQILLFITIVLTHGLSDAASHKPLGLGEVANNLMEPVGLFSDFIFSGCFIIGTGFVFASIVKYIEHRRSPLMVPISTVIFLLIAGIILILLPFASYITDTGIKYTLFR